MASTIRGFPAAAWIAGCRFLASATRGTDRLKFSPSDNLNQRIIVYSIDDGHQPQPQITMTANIQWDAANPAPASYAIYKHVSGQTPVKVANLNLDHRIGFRRQRRRSTLGAQRESERTGIRR